MTCPRLLTILITTQYQNESSFHFLFLGRRGCYVRMTSSANRRIFNLDIFSKARSFFFVCPREGHVLRHVVERCSKASGLKENLLVVLAVHHVHLHRKVEKAGSRIAGLKVESERDSSITSRGVFPRP